MRPEVPASGTNPAPAEIHCQRGNALLQLGRNDEAVAS